MKNLKLNLDEIKVESFETLGLEKTKKGTVVGYELPETDAYPTECCTLVTWCNCAPLTRDMPWTLCL